MAEFCKKCAEIYEMKNHDEPCFCEECKKYVDNRFKILRYFISLFDKNE